MANKKVKKGRALPPLSPAEIRRREVLQVGARFKDEDKNFLAAELEQARESFDVTINDVLTRIVRNARLQASA